MTNWIEPASNKFYAPLPGLHPLVGQALVRRGMTDAKLANTYLHPDQYSPAPASALPGLTAAVSRIIQSIEARDHICVWGDFDVDGQTSTTLLVQTLQALDANVSFHIPVRATESHGVNLPNLKKVIDEGAKLVITCDTGISATEAVDFAKTRGVDMIISDHHDLPLELPNATAVINSKMLPENHPLATLAGVGVAYKLAEELITQLQPSNLRPQELLDLVALGLVADLAILRADARYLVQKGLEQLRQTTRLGIKTMMELAELAPIHLTEEHIGFILAPRMNALGRLGDANPIIELLCTDNPVRARMLAELLEGLNVKRKLLCDQVFRAAEAQLLQNPELLTQPVIILAHPQWPGGVVGIVASQIVERYHKPAILFTAPVGEPLRGSARSIEGLNITAAIAAQKELLIGFGGHPMAAGLALEAEKLGEFRRKLAKTIEKMLANTPAGPAVLEIDGWLELDDANIELAEQLENLAPFGPGNRKLVLASQNVSIKSSSRLGKNQEHLKLTIETETGAHAQVLWWNAASEDLPKQKFDLAYTLRASDWRGARQAQLELIDFRPCENKKIVIETKTKKLLDFRGVEKPFDVLKGQNQEPDTLCWAEAEDKKLVGGQDRNNLTAAKTLIIWTTPPSPAELKIALNIVKPEKIIIFGIDPAACDHKAFLERLSGLVKFILNKKAGKTSYSELAAATAQKEAAVRLGLEWLSREGQVTIHPENGDALYLSLKSSLENDALGIIQAQLISVLDESAAYREYFRKQINLALE